jgi:hypothetical protein
MRKPLLEQEAHPPGDGTGHKERHPMNDNLRLAAYTAAHRTRQRGLEDGYVDKTGKREKKWRGWYHVYVKKDDGTETRIKRKRIIGPVVGMTKAQAEEEHRIWIRRFHTLPAAETPAATVATLCDDLFQLREGDWEDAARSCNASVFGLIKAGLVHARSSRSKLTI